MSLKFRKAGRGTRRMSRTCLTIKMPGDGTLNDIELSVCRVETRLAPEMLNVGSCRVESRHSLYSRVSTGCHGVVSPMLFSFAEALTIFPKNFSFSISIRDS